MEHQIIPITDNTWRIENGFVRIFLIAGSEKALLIDTGASLPDARSIAESLVNVPVELICTHGDGDHTSGTAAFAEYFVHHADYENCRMAEKYPDSRPLPIADGDIIDLGGRKLRLIHIPGHTFGSVAILDEATRSLISGDSVQDGHIFMFGAHRSPVSYAASLEKLVALEAEYDRILPSHGSAELPAGYARTVREAWRQVLAGNIAPAEADMHGVPVLSYDADGCGFYCGKN